VCAYLGSFSLGQACGLELLLQAWHTLCLCVQAGLVIMQPPHFCLKSLLLSCVCSYCLHPGIEKIQQNVVKLLVNP